MTVLVVNSTQILTRAYRERPASYPFRDLQIYQIYMNIGILDHALMYYLFIGIYMQHCTEVP